MQLRGEKKEIMRKYAEANIGKYAKNEPNAFISKTVELKEGPDLYIGSQKAARQLSVAMRKVYNVECTITKKIHGMRQGKEISRWTIFLGPSKGQKKHTASEDLSDSETDSKDSPVE